MMTIWQYGKRSVILQHYSGNMARINIIRVLQCTHTEDSGSYSAIDNSNKELIKIKKINLGDYNKKQ